MDEQSRKVLDDILAKEPAALTDSDKEFLRARRSYLNAQQQAVYAEVLGDAPDSVEETSEDEDTSVEAKPKKGKKSKKAEEPEETSEDEA